MATQVEIAELQELIEDCYSGSEIIKLYGEEMHSEASTKEQLKELLTKYRRIDFGDYGGVGSGKGIFMCEADPTGYSYEIVKNMDEEALSYLGYTEDIMECDFTHLAIICQLASTLESTKIDTRGALAIAYQYLLDIEMEDLIYKISRYSFDEKLELDTIKLICSLDVIKLNELLVSISTKRLTHGIEFVTMLRDAITFKSLGKNAVQKADILGINVEQLKYNAINNIIYKILRETTYEIDISILDRIKEAGKYTNQTFDITYGTETASTRPIDSEKKYKEAYEEYSSTHKNQLDRLSGMELCRLCMIAKYTTYSAEEAFELASSDDKYNEFIQELYNGK